MMNKSLLTFIVLLVSAIPSFSQSTTVSGTVTDTPDGQAWFNGTYSFVFRVAPSNPTAQYFWNGVPFSSSQTIAGALDGSGHYSQVVPSNTSITPAGSTWDVTFCPQATAQCVTYQSTTITGATQTFSPSPASIRINLAVPLQNPKAYTDTEIVNGALGQTYFNLVSTVIRVCSVFPCGWTNSSGGTSITLQTNGGANPVQSLLNIKNGTGVTVTADGSGGVTITSLSCGTTGTGIIQASNGSGGCQASNLSESASGLNVNEAITVTGTATNRGPNPRVDATSAPFFARVVNPNTIPVTTGTITGGTNSLAVASAANFLKNDGIVAVGMGATNCATAPSAPTAVASLASSSTGTGWMVAGGTGSTSVSYSLIAISGGGCYTAASPVVTVSNSNNSMGANTLAITSQAIAAGSNVITVTVGSTTGLATGFWGLIDGTTDNQEFGGYHHFTVVDGTHLSYVGNIDSRYFMSSLSATGGTLYYKAGNHLTFPALPAGTNMQFYAVYRCIGASCALPANAGNYSLVYMSYPANLGFTDATYNQWDDFGTTLTPALTANFGYPWFLPSTPPSTNVNDALVTQITGISGNTFTLHDNAINSTTSSPVRFGNDYAITTANAAVPKTVTGGGGTVYLPPPVENPATNNFCYVTSSYLTISAGAFNQGGAFCAGATITLNSNWSGTNEDGGRLVRPNFANQSEIPFECLGANPCILRAGTSIRNVTIQSFGPGTMLVFDTSQNQTVTENVNFSTDGGSTDYMGILYYFYGNTGNAFGGSFNNTSWSVGPVQTVGATDTPLFISKNGGEWTLNYMSGNRRGFYFECSPPVLSCEFTEVLKMGEEWQGPIAPLITLNNAGAAGNVQGLIYLEHFFQDSGEAPMFVNASTVGAVGSPIFINQSNAPGNNMPIISGDFFNGGIAISTSVPINNNQIGMNHDLTQCMGQENQGNAQGYTGCRLPALNLATASYGVSHTLTGSEGIVKATASAITFTLPHALAGQTWEILNPTSSTITLTIDSGTLSGNGATGPITIAANTGGWASCDGTNCNAFGFGGGGGGGSPGGTVNALQSNNGAGGFQGLNPPVVPGDYIVHYPTPTTTPVAPARDLPGVPINPQTVTTYVEGSANYQSDRAFLITANNAGAQTYTMGNPSAAGFGQNYFNVLHNIGAGAVTENASGFTVNGGASLLVPPSWVRFLWSDGVNYRAARFPDYNAFPVNCTTAITIVSGVFSCGAAGSVSSWSGDGALYNNVNSTGAVTATLANASANTVWGRCLGTTGLPSYCQITDAMLTAVSHAALFNVANTWTGLQDFSGATWKFPASAGATASATNTCTLDTTNRNIHCYINNADAIVASVASTPTNNDCAKWTVVSGTVQLGDAGAPCGSGGGGGGGGLIISPNPQFSVLQPQLVFNTPSASVATNISAATGTMVSLTNTIHQYKFEWVVSLTTPGTSCTGTTTVVLNAVFTNPSNSTPVTQSLGTITLATNSNGTAGFITSGVTPILAAPGTAVQFSTSSFTAGSGCSPAPSYQVQPTLLQEF